MATERTTLRFSHNATQCKTGCTYHGDWNFYGHRARSIKTAKQFKLYYSFFPFGCGWKLCTTHIVVLEQDVPYQTSVRLFLLGSWAYACNGMTHWAKPPLNIFHFLFKQVRIFCLLHFSELTKMTRSVFSLMLTILDGQNCIVILSIFILQKTNNWA